MQWSDTGYVVALRRHGESALIAELLTREHGRHLGLVRGGQSPKLRAILQTGNEVAAVWRGRLSAHLGTLACELVRGHAGRFIDDPGRLAALSAAAALVAATLPEREPHPDVFASFAALLDAIDSTEEWPAHYVGWECRLLASLGFGLDTHALRRDRRHDRTRLCFAAFGPRGIPRGGPALPRQAIAIARVLMAKHEPRCSADHRRSAPDRVFLGASRAVAAGQWTACRPRSPC